MRDPSPPPIAPASRPHQPGASDMVNHVPLTPEAPLDSITALAAAHARHTEARSRVTAENIAHVDTPGFQRGRGPVFAQMLGGTSPFAMTATHPSHIAPDDAAPGFAVTRDGPVKLQHEMVDLAANRRAHDLNVAVSAAFHRFHMSTAR